MTSSEETFDTLAEAISYAFRKEQTSMLALEKICQVLSAPNLFIKGKTSGIVPCSTVTRRRISSTLSSSDLFVRAGPPRTCLWAIRPHNPLFISDGQISASLESVLTSHGPLTLEQIAASSELSGADDNLFEHFLNEHSSEFTMDSESKTYWFAGQPRPTANHFENISTALVYAFKNFPAEGASVEELHWFLCLSTVGNQKFISRRSVSRELSRRPDVFIHLSRAKYMLANQQTMPPPRPVSQLPMLPSFSPPIQVFAELMPSSSPPPQPILAESRPLTPQMPMIGNSPMPRIEFFPITDSPDVKPLDDDLFNPEGFFSTDFQFAFD